MTARAAGTRSEDITCLSQVYIRGSAFGLRSIRESAALRGFGIVVLEP